MRKHVLELTAAAALLVLAAPLVQAADTPPALPGATTDTTTTTNTTTTTTDTTSPTASTGSTTTTAPSAGPADVLIVSLVGGGLAMLFRRVAVKSHSHGR